ncbi:SGNH/GDSL hydrolase family protein [Hydrogenophaga sp.]|uniref:SGNH/GDSL hydrolase family protein n=1 Tax=Hydrogenophaga sp. TaxID=1904254 RepID=UPI002717A9BF|nr:SGNH/GDSL hydrolase family protein [Hydrogenophaga sp.]MDO9436074.1 SGNH/GDSL hydrolase family protein [Hydrogenophaga sp.]
MFIRIGLTAAVTALILAACGGGGSGSSSNSNSNSGVQTTSVKVVGDSLNDSGTAGYKFTVQGTPPYPIWTERVTTALAAPALCPRYSAPGGVPALNPAATACTSFGVGGAAINRRGLPDDTTPFSILQQLKDLGAQGAYGAQDLLLVDGGGNDLSDLAGDYVKLLVAADGAPFDALTSELVAAGDMIGLQKDQVGDLYVTKLADTLVDTLISEALNRGAQRIVVLTAPDVTRTPKYLDAMVIANAFFPFEAAQIQTAVTRWVQTFNNRLKARLAMQSRVLVVDFYAELNKWLGTPAVYGLTNTTKPACPAKINVCIDTALSAAPPVGESGPDWWKTYVFSDNFHGTPRTNELMGEAVVRAIEAKGWK